MRFVKQVLFVLRFKVFYLALFLAAFIGYKISKSENPSETINSTNTFLSTEWIINGIVTQYSSVASLNLNRQVDIESLVFVDTNTQNENELSQTINCLIKIDNNYLVLNTSILRIRLNPNKYNVSFMWRVKCTLKTKEHKYLFDRILVSILDSEWSFNFNKKLDYILFQKPSFYNQMIPKIKSIANCVHMVYAIDKNKLNRILNWIQIQKEFGLNKIKFYFWQVDEYIKKEILKENFDFVQIVEYKTNFDQVCHWFINKLKQYPNSDHYKQAYDYCSKAYQRFFDLNDVKVKANHKRVCSNDCLFNFKYSYEYVTNYDFDEFIFPRYFNTNLSLDFKKANNQQNNLTYNLYSYAKKLTNIYGQNVAYFYFENVMFLNNFKSLIDKILQFNTKNNTLEIISYNIEPYKIDFRLNLEQDLKKIKSFQEYQNYIKCLNNSISKNLILNPKWNNLYATPINRAGKSIYRTDFTESYNPHYADRIKANTHAVKVPLDLGYSSHFRDDDLIWGSLSYSFDKLFMDIEYYNFLFRFSQNLKFYDL